MKYYIEYYRAKAKVREEFSDIPEDIYFALGSQDESDKDKAYLMRGTDRGTCLLPFRVIQTNEHFKKQ